MLDEFRQLMGLAHVFTPTLVVLGLLVGSFLNVVIHRLPKMLEANWRRECAELQALDTEDAAPTFNLLHPRSCCPGCGTQIRAIDNIPLLSFIALRGHCRACGNRIPLRYPLVEAGAGMLAWLVAEHFGPGAQALAGIGFCWALLALAVIDLDTMLLPDDLTLPLLWAGLFVNLNGWFIPLETAVIGAMAGYLSLWLIYQLFRLVTHKEGMGFGDFKLLAALGAWLGWQALPTIVLGAAGVGAITGLSLIACRRLGHGKPMPFGPFLAAAGIINLLWGDALMRLFIPGAGL